MMLGRQNLNFRALQRGFLVNMSVFFVRVLGGYVLGAKQKLRADQPLPQQKLKLSHHDSWLDHGDLAHI